MNRVIRFLLLGAGFAILVGTIARGVSPNSSRGGERDPWFHRTFAARRAKPPRPQTQTTSSPTRDAQAVSLAQQAVSALVGSTSITDATVQATANYTAGSDQESGTATLLAHAGYESNVALSLSGGQRSEVHNGSSAIPQADWSGTDGARHAFALHNRWVDPAWFFPALTLQSSLNDPQMAFVYVGQESKDGVAVQHIRVSRLLPGQSQTSTALIQQLSQVDIYVDATSFLPVALDFNQHPERTADENLPVEIVFSGWHAVNGIEIPARIQKFLQGSLLMDLSITSSQVNTGLPPSDFTVQATTP